MKIGFSDLFLHVGQLNEEEAEYLGLEAGLPKLYIESIFHLTNGSRLITRRFRIIISSRSLSYRLIVFAVELLHYGRWST